MLLEKHISTSANAKILVLFGGNPLRRDEVIRHLKTVTDLSIIGTLLEEEGIKVIQELPKVDLVLIGGRYTTEQRFRIKTFIAENYPHIKVTEPGIEYPYDEEMIKNQVQKLMQ